MLLSLYAVSVLQCPTCELKTANGDNPALHTVCNEPVGFSSAVGTTWHPIQTAASAVPGLPTSHHTRTFCAVSGRVSMEYTLAMYLDLVYPAAPSQD